MDKLDKEILKILSQNWRTSFKQISEAVGLTSPAVKTRIEKMEKDNIIKGYSVNLDNKAVGFMVTAFISVAVETASRDEFYSYVQSCPNVIECHGITGQYFALLKVLFKSTMDLDNFLNKIQKFGETSTNIVLSTYKEPHNINLMDEEI